MPHKSLATRGITGWVKGKLSWLESNGRENEEFGFTVHGTMADPRWLDVTVDANDRKENWCYLGDPKIVNMSPVGLARSTSLRSWLSRWSCDDANADGPKSAAKITKPVLVVNNSADDACTPSHAQRLFDGVMDNNKEMYSVKGATPYYQGQPDLGREAVNKVRDWLMQQGFDV